jgi:hypothetical protein
MKIVTSAVLITLLAGTAFAQVKARPKRNDAWTFAASGDSRNCGDVVMPSIAAAAAKNNAAFYWHLGDLRAIYAVDEDYQHSPEHRGKTIAKDDYLKDAWDDFIQNQLGSFGSMPVFVGIGNHETIAPKTREQFAETFAKWLDAPTLSKQRLADNPQDSMPRTYFHWIQGGVDFIYLDNATLDQFSPEQMTWLSGVLDRASTNKEVRALVVGMHAALPDSLASGHSMNDWPTGAESGRRVYTELLNFKKKTRKHVYLLASHSHFYMSGIFKSENWKAQGELPGWIVGTAGAVRYALPPDSAHAKEARTKVYGVLLGTVHNNGAIDFKFEEVKRDDVPAAISERYTPEFVHFCFHKNTAYAETDAPPQK